MKIAIAGVGYVGLSLATLLSQNNEVFAVDIDKNRVELVNNRKSPIKDEYIEKFFNEKKLNLTATLDFEEAFSKADYIIIATPTNYVDDKNYFDTSAVISVIERVNELSLKNPDFHPTVVVKSTIPVGFIESTRKQFPGLDIFFSPEFLREGKALYDNLYPSRIVIGANSKKAKKFAELLVESAEKKDIPVIYMGATEAEAVKLFANTYLALRVAYFNELDTYAEMKGLNSRDIIDGMCLDPRIGGHYNNPSFGFGGYCLPKDTKQLLANYHGVPQSMISAIVDANKIRKQHIANEILIHQPKTVGIYRLTMKSESDNFRASAIFDIIEILKKSGVKVIVFEPTIQESEFDGNTIENDLEEFKKHSDIIVANRPDDCLSDVKNKLYTRDLYSRD